MGIDDLLVLAKRSGVTTIAITDHDCLAGTVRAKIIGERYGITVIPAVELSCTDEKRGSKAHLLCYYPDKPERLEGLCRRNSVLRKTNNRLMALKVAQRFPVTSDFIVKCASGSTNLYKQHIMRALLEAGYTTTIYGELYDKLFGTPAPEGVLIPTSYPTPQETLEEIHAAGGIAVLAHPGQFDNFELLEELIELGLDGVEAVYQANLPLETPMHLRLARAAGLAVTAGSDFHGANKSAITLGMDVEDEESFLAPLFAALAKRGSHFVK